MKARPILFQPPMVEAIRAGRKTQTRRVARPQTVGRTVLPPSRCPYGVPGDELWVREPIDLYSIPVGLQAAPQLRRGPVIEHGRHAGKVQLGAIAVGEPAPGAWCTLERRVPAIFAPRWASRVRLRLTDVRFERLGDIDQGDAIDEGMASLGEDWLREHFPEYMCELDRVRAHNAALTAAGQRLGHTRPPLGPSPLERFQRLWISIHGAWRPKTWVWALTFEPIEVGWKEPR